MSPKLTQGSKLPALALNLTDGQSRSLPDDRSGRYLVLLFYRGNW
jgi:peroxiredoxin